MMYKIMSTVKAHLNEEKQIVSPAQTLLKNNILQTSELIPEKIRKKITSSNVVVDKNSLCRDGICRGDIYVETNDSLGVLEQRQLVDGMAKISKRYGGSLMSPVVIRNAPDDMPEPVLPDVITMPPNETHDELSAFVGAKATLLFPIKDSMKSTYRRADIVAKALNKELNAVGMRTVFADTSACVGENPIQRDCCIMMQKTARFNPMTFSEDKLITAIQNGLLNEKIGLAEPSRISLINPAGQPALIGTISLENIQMAGKRAIEQMRGIESLPEAALVFTMMEQNPLFANGIGRDGERMISEIVDKFNVPRYPKLVEPLFATDVTQPVISGFHSSTEQPLSTKWQPANAIAIHLSGERQIFDSLYDNIDDVVDSVNEAYGCDEQHPLIDSALFGVKTRIGDYKAQALYLNYNPSMMAEDISVTKKNISETFTKILSEYYGSSINVNGNQPQPLMIDVSTAKPFKQPLVMTVNKPVKEHLTANVIQPSLEAEQQISL